MANKEFVHRFQDRSEVGRLSIDLDPPDGAVIEIRPVSGGDVWVSANPAGWRHLARICAELGVAEFGGGYHFHRTTEFRSSEGSPEVTFEVA